MSYAIKRVPVILALIATLLLTATGLANATTGSAGRVLQVTYEILVKNIDEGRATTDVLVKWPVAVTDRAGHQRVLSSRFEPQPAKIEESETGLLAYYEVSQIPVGTEMTLRQTFVVELAEGAAAVVAETGAEENLASYLEPEAGIESDDPAIQAKAAELAGNVTGNAAKAEAIMIFVTDHLRYRGNSPVRNKGALAGFLAGEGVCTEYANLFVAMARSQGVPARVVHGWGARKLEGSVNKQYNHAWAEYWDEERGWVAVDPTFSRLLPKSKVMTFDPANHLARSFGGQPMSAEYKGGWLSVEYQLVVADTTVSTSR